MKPVLITLDEYKRRHGSTVHDRALYALAAGPSRSRGVDSVGRELFAEEDLDFFGTLHAVGKTMERVGIAARTGRLSDELIDQTRAACADISRVMPLRFPFLAASSARAKRTTLRGYFQ